MLAFLSSALCLPAQDAGVIPRWEVLELAKNLDQSTKDVGKILAQLRPKEWTQQGAPSAYVEQLQTLESDLGNLALSVQGLVRKPEKLTTAIDTFLWLERVGSMLTSMATGVRKYQNAALADLLDSAGNRATSGEEKLKQYLRQLAVEREAEFEITHNEAQRCRERLARQPPAGK